MHKGLKGFQKGNKNGRQFQKGHKTNLGKTWKQNKPFTLEHKRKIGLANSISLKGKKSSEESKKKMRESKINHPNRIFKDTDIELKTEIELQKRGINYQKQVPLCKIAIVDFYLPEHRIVIQCDGDYWHNRKGSKERDEKQDKVLTFNGFNVYRFWGHEINESIKNCIDKLF